MLWYIFIGSVVLFVLFILDNMFNKLFFYSNKESFKSDYSDYTTIDRIIVDDKYAYCIGANATCKNGHSIKKGTYANGDTYGLCDDGSPMICNNFISKMNLSDNIWKTPDNVPIKMSSIYKGFTEPTNYIPAVINKNTINFYDKNSNILDSINKCSILGTDKNNCLSAVEIPYTYADISNQSTNDYNNRLGYIAPPSAKIQVQPDSYTQKNPISTGKSGMYPNFPCIADYGAMPGDNVCNDTLIKDNTLICPYYKPICAGYRCGNTFGKCIDSNV